MLTDEQQQVRASGVGASEVAAICGLNPYKSALAVYMDKVNLTDHGPETEASEWGHRLETVIARKYAESIVNENLVVALPEATYRHKKESWMLCTPDGLVVPRNGHPAGDQLSSDSGIIVSCPDPRESAVRGLEIKTAGLRQAWRWGTEGDAVPEPYLLQCAWSMKVLDLPRWDLAALIGGQEYRQYVIERDNALEAMVVSLVTDFWQHVLDRVPPEPDASDSAKSALSKIFSTHSATLLQATEEAQELAFKLKKAREDADIALTAQRELENKIKYIIAENAGVEGAFGRITWKRSKDSKRTDWKSACAEAGVPNEIVAKHTTMSPGSRRFLTHWAD